ncbi:MAG TPA: GAF domain-containing protein [Anaerolineales bacterium]|nr:GAF domain-containing protein [Anaerolineales bacterium]
MPKKKPIDKRLKTLFEDVNPEQAPAEFRPVSGKRASEEMHPSPAEVELPVESTRPIEVVSRRSQPASGLSLAFQAGQDSWATLQVLDEATERQWTQDEQLLVKQVADQLSLALENARLFQETQTRAEELSVLNEMARELSAKLEVSAIAGVVYRYTSRLIDTGNFSFTLYDEKSGEKSFPLVFEQRQQVHLKPAGLGNRSLSDFVIRNKQAVLIRENVLGNMQTLGIDSASLSEGHVHPQCWLGVPMMLGNRVLGLISVQHFQQNSVYDEHHREILTTIASQAAIAIENARLFEETQLRADETARLNKLVTRVAETLDMQKNLQIIADEIADYTSALHVGIALIDKEQHVLILSADAPFQEGASDIGIRIPIAGNPTAEPVIHNREPLFINDTPNHPATAHIAEILKIRGTQSLFIWPIIAGRDVIGTLGIDFADPFHQLTENQKNLISTILFQASTSIQNARLFQEARRRAQETAALAEVGREISVTLDLETVLTRIASFARDLFQAESSAVYLPEADGAIWRAISVVGDEAEEIKNDPLNTGEGILGQIVLRKAGQIVNNASSEAGALIVQGTPERPHDHLMGVPILTADQTTGLMAVWRSGQGREFTPAELDFLTSLARQAAIAIQNARLFKEAEIRAEELATLNQLAQTLSLQLEPEQIVNTIYTGITRLIDARNFYVAFYDAETNEIVFPQNVSESDADRQITRLPMGQGITSHIIKTGESVLITQGSDVWMKERGLPTAGAPAKSFLGVPLSRGGRALGAMAVQSYDQFNAYDRHDLQLLTAFAGQVAVALENARLFQATQKSEGELRALFASMNDVIIVYDRDGRYVRIAPTNPSLLVRPPEEMIGKYISEILPADLHLQFMAAIHEALAGERIIRIEYPLTIGGNPFWFDASVSKLNDEQVFWVARDITERKLHELTQIAITQISETALTARTMDELFTSIHAAIQPLLPATNFYIAQYDSHSNLITFPYHKDEIETEWTPRRLGRGMTSYVIRTGKALRATPEVFAELEASGEVVLDGTLSVDWLGVPLRAKQVVNGVMAIQTYDYTSRITEQHQETLSLIATQAAAAIERFLAEREIQKFKLGIDRSNNPVFITDLDGSIQYANPAFEQVYGFSNEEILGRTPRIIKSGLTSNEEYRIFWSRLLGGETIATEVTNQSKDGRLIPIAATYSPILDESGKMIGFLAVHEDITERKLSEETLRRRNDYLAASTEIGRLVTSTLDLNTIFTRTVSLISDRFGFYYAGIYIIEETGFHAVLREATGEAGEKMKAQRHSVVVGSNSIVGKVAQNIEPMLVNDTEFEPLHAPNPYLLDTRSEVAIPLRIGLRIVGVIDIQSTQPHAFTQDDLSVLQSLADQVAVAIDNARSYELSQQLIQELREIDLLKSQFLANMSHELRTPLNSIIGFSRVILKGIDGPVTEMQQQDLTAIYNSGQHLLGLINDILDLARIEAGKMELNFEEVHLAEMTTSVMSTAKGLVKEKPIQLLHRIPENMPTVRGDAMRVRQVLLNLISNAAKFTETGSITVESLVQKSPSGKLEALINVIDTGPGISADDQKKLFQAFSQVDGSATRKTGGTGLGLSICANLVQLHGGRIGVHSAVGTGSVFWFTLPLYYQPEEKIPEGKKVILAIDDDPQVIGLYERYLTPQGYYVLPLTDSSKAKEQVLKVRPYAITLDVMMPNKDGWSVLTELKSDPATRDYPVIICSILEQAERGFSLGAADYLVKPILEEELVEALDRLNKDGIILEVLVIDDDPSDLRLVEKILQQHGRYKPVLAEGGRKGWEAINSRPPHAIILDLFMPEMDGFHILERLQETPALRDIPVLVVSGGGLTTEQQEQLKRFGQRLISKGSLNESQLIATIENSLKRIGP